MKWSSSARVDISKLGPAHSPFHRSFLARGDAAHGVRGRQVPDRLRHVALPPPHEGEVHRPHAQDGHARASPGAESRHTYIDTYRDTYVYYRYIYIYIYIGIFI